jgi:phosphoserine phosphatase
MRAHIFDMDGTLLPGTKASLLLAQALGMENALRALEERFAAGKHTSVEFAQNLHATWGVVPAATAANAFANAPLLDNVEAVLRDIRARGERACLITLSPDYFAELLLPFGFDAVYSSTFPRDAQTPLDPGKILSAHDKPRLARVFCEEYGLRLEEAIAYGDSISDVFLFEAAGYRISLNGDHHLRDLCDIEIRGNDLYQAYGAARQYIDRRDGRDRKRDFCRQ